MYIKSRRRIGNVKVGKFTASVEDMASEDYNEEEYENLNDIETVLDSIGIKLRENATTYKDTEEVLEEFENALIAKEITGIDNGSIGRVCAGKQKTAGGYKWKFKE